MATTTPFLDLEQRLFSGDPTSLDRAATRYVLMNAAVVARRRMKTDRYRAVTPPRAPNVHAA